MSIPEEDLSIAPEGLPEEDLSGGNISTDISFKGQPLSPKEVVPEDRMVTPKTGLQKTVEFGVPMIGAIVGGVFGGPAGGAGGAAMGQLTLDLAKKAIPGGEDPTLLKVAANAGLAGTLDYVFGKGFSVIGKTPAVRALVSSTDDFIKNGGQGRLSKVITNTGTFLSNSLGQVPKEQQESYISRTAQKLAHTTGIPENVIKRGYTRGFKNILNPKNFDTKTGSLRPQTIDTMVNVSEEAFKEVEGKFNALVEPILQGNKRPLNITSVINNFKNNMDELTSVEKIKVRGPLVDASGRAIMTEQEKRTLSSAVDKAAFSDLTSILTELKKISKDATPMQLHKFKRLVNQTVKKGLFKENPEAQRMLYSLHTDIRDRIGDVIPAYKDVTDEFRFLFKLEETLGRKFTTEGVEKLTKDYFSLEKEGLRVNLNKFISKSDKARGSFNKALDERNALFFRHNFSDKSKRVDIPIIPGKVGILIPLSSKAPAPAAVGRKLMKKEAKKILGTPPLARAVPAGLSTIPASSLGLIFEEQ